MLWTTKQALLRAARFVANTSKQIRARAHRKKLQCVNATGIEQCCVIGTDCMQALPRGARHASNVGRYDTIAWDTQDAWHAALEQAALISTERTTNTCDELRGWKVTQTAQRHSYQQPQERMALNAHTGIQYRGAHLYSCCLRRIK